MTKHRILIIVVIAMIAATCLTIGLGIYFSCNSSLTPDHSDSTDSEANFSVSGTTLTLSQDYTLTEEDITYIQSEGICTFNLNYYTLDLNGYTIKLSSSEEGIKIAFNSGTITNGSLDISVPNGDISFDRVTITESVTYLLEAAPETIIISNATLSGSCTIVSNSNVVVTYSTVSDITLEGDGTLVARSNAELGSVTVNASGAQVTVSEEATVSSISLNSSATVTVSGTVSEISVSENVVNDENSPSITVNYGASVDSIALDAAAEVTVGGSVSSVSVSETAASDTSELTIEVTYSASVSSISLNSAAELTIAGEVTSVSVSENIDNDANLSISVTSDAIVNQITLNSSATVNVNGTVTIVVVNETAAGADIKLYDSASVKTVAVAAEGTTVTVSESNESDVSVVVADTVSEINVTGTDTTIVTADELATFIAELHEHAYIVSSRTNATCTETGEIAYKCANCDATTKETIAALGHLYVYDNVTGSDGTIVRRGTCVRCGYTKDFEAESVSIFVSGVEALVSLIPDGTYTISSEDGLSITEDDATVTFKDIELLITIENDYMYGTLSLTVVQAYNSSTTEIGISGMIDGNAVYFNYNEYYSNDNYTSTDEVNGYISLATALKGLIIYMFDINFDIDSAITDISDILADSDTFALLEGVIAAIAEVAFETATDNDGNTIYTFDAEKLYKVLEEYGNKTPSTVIVELYGDGTYSALKELATDLADMKVEDLADTLIETTENLGISKDALFVMVENFLYYGTSEEIDIDEMIAYYADSTVAEALAAIAGGNVEYFKETIEEHVAMIFGEDGLMDTAISNLFDSGIFPVDFTYEQILEAIHNLKDGAQFSLTFDGEGSIVAVSLCYTLNDTPVIEVTWENGDLIPTVNIDLEEIVQTAIAAEETDDGIELTIGYAGITLEITLTSTDDGYDIDVETSDETELEYGLKVSGSFTVAKDDEAIPDEEITAALEDTFTLADMENELTFILHPDDYRYRTVTITHGEDSEGEYYILTYTSVYASTSSGQGYMSTYVYTMRIDFVDGMPDWMMLCVDNCDDWIYISAQAIGMTDVTYTYTYGIIERNADGSFSMTKQDSSRTDEYSYSEYYALSFSGYYNPATGETAYESQHNYAVSDISTISSNTSGLCEDGLLITYKCSNCGDSHYSICYGHFYDYEYTYYYTIDDSYSYYCVGTCRYCGELDSYIAFYEYRHDMTWANTYTLYVEDSVVYVDDIADSTYIDLLEDNGIDTTGFYYGYVNVNTCSTCGIDYYMYTIYTYTEKDGCVYHYIILLDYGGHEGYDAFTIAYEDYSYKGHAYTESSGNVAGANKEYVTIAEDAISEMLHFTEDIGELSGYTEVSCPECGELTRVSLTFCSKDTETWAYSTISVSLYYSDGELKQVYLTFYGEDAEAETYTGAQIYLYYSNSEPTSYETLIYSSDPSTYERYIDMFDLTEILSQLSGIPEEYTYFYTEIFIWSGSYYTESNIYLNYESKSTSIYLNVYLSDYYNEDTYGNARMYSYTDNGHTVNMTYYEYYDREWNSYDEDTYYNHSYTVICLGENCAEDGKKYECTVCDYYYTSYSHSYYSSHTTVCVNDIDGLYEGTIDGLTATVYYDYYCPDCYTYINVTIVLEDNWTLQGDVYIKAEEQVALNLNGYTIDLNGYALIIYGYNGSHITITDGEYSEDMGGCITDSSENDDGLLVVFTNGGTIIFGSISIDCDSYASDTDYRSTIFQSVYEENGKKIELLSE